MKKTFLTALSLCLLLGLALTGCASANSGTATPAAAKSETATPGKTTVVTSGSSLAIDVADVSEKAAFYPVDVDGTKLEVLAVKAPDGTIRTAFNTCQVCYDSGRGYYKQEGDVLVCQNCGNQFPMSHVEVTSGGCNPVGIFDDEKTVTDTTISVSYDFLSAAKVIFAQWKS
jgi:uncharacterized membrane protein